MSGNKIIALLFIILLSAAYDVDAATRYVSPDGTALWANCTAAETPCSLATANSNASAGDTIMMADGDYGTSIMPVRAGTIDNRITYRATNKYGAIIKNPTAWYTGRQAGVIIRYSYIVVDGVKVDATTFTAGGPNHLLWFPWGSSHSEIKNCWFTGPAYMQSYYTTNVWFHDNLIDSNNKITYDADSCDDVGYGLQVGSTGASMYGYDGNWTIENNTFRWGGHHNLETFTKKNVVRNNFFHNEGSMTDPGVCVPNPDSNGKYGNRNFQIYDHSGADGVFNLVEGNRFGPSGIPPDDTGWGGEGLTVTSPKNIVRYNEVYDAADGGIMMKTGYNALADNNRIFNNTVYHSGRHNPGNYTVWPGANLTWYGNYARTGNVIKNNIFYSYGTGGADWYGGSATIYTDNTVTNNLCTDAAAGRCVSTSDPLFTDGTLPAITSTPITTDPDLTLQAGSPAIDTGTYLTQANGAGTDSTTLIVDDALYFQDGTWGSSLAGHTADWIALGTVGNTVQISSINYATNTITLASAKTWADNANIWLYKKSDGDVVLNGTAPDLGAHETLGGEDVTAPTVSSISVGTNGTYWTFQYSENVTCASTADCCRDYTAAMTTAGAITLTYLSGSGTSTVICTGSPQTLTGDTIANGGADYTTRENGIEDAAGNDLASFENKAVTNNSTAVADILVISTSTDGYCYFSPNAVEVPTGDTQEFSVTTDYGYTVASVSGCGGSGTTTYTTGSISEACTVSCTSRKRMIEGIGTGSGSLTGIGSGAGTMQIGD